MKEKKKKQAGWQLPSQLWGRGWGKGSLYLRQALHMMKEEKLFSGIYIAGTALAVAFTMVIVMAYNFKIARVYPEVNRANTYYWNSLRAFNHDGDNEDAFEHGVGYAMVERLKKMKSVEKVGVTNFTSAGSSNCMTKKIQKEKSRSSMKVSGIMYGVGIIRITH